MNFFGGLPLGKEIVSLNINSTYYREISIFGSSSQSIYDFHKALNLVSCGALNVKRFITHRLPLEETPKAFEIASSKAD